MGQSFLRYIDKTIRPQDDLYLHVNNKWMQDTEIPKEESVWGVFNELAEANYKKLHLIIKELLIDHGVKEGSIEQKVRDFYISANDPDVESKGLKAVNKLFKEVDQTQKKDDLAALLGKLHGMCISAFWDYEVGPDDKKSDEYILHLGQSGLSLPNRDYYFMKDKKMQRARRKFKRHILEMFKVIGYFNTGKEYNEEIFTLERTLARNSMTNTQLRDLEAQYNKFKFDQLQELVPSINWEEYFKAIGISPPLKLIVHQPHFLKAINEVLNTTPLSIIKHYLKWHILISSSPYLGERVAQANFEFFGKELSGIPKMKPRWRRAVASINSCIGEALGQLYINRFFPPEAKKRINELIEDLRAVFKSRIDNLNWMDQKTKELAKEKLDKVMVKVGYPSKLLRYEGLSIKPDSYLSNYLNSQFFEAKRQLSKLGKPVDQEEWFMPPQTVNAYYNPNMNEIVFPAGILQPPFFDFEADDAINYGAIGMVIGHELTHGFDDKGCLFDAHGNLKNWWKKEVKASFDIQAEAMVAQADSYEVLPNKYLNGKLTLGENIADLGGAQIAYQALGKALARHGRPGLIDGYEPEQRFFLSLAHVWCRKVREERAQELLIIDSHASDEFRSNNPARNTDAFYEVFNVKPTDKMFLPEGKRVRIW